MFFVVSDATGVAGRWWVCSELKVGGGSLSLIGFDAACDTLILRQ